MRYLCCSRRAFLGHLGAGAGLLAAVSLSACAAGSRAAGPSPPPSAPATTTAQPLKTGTVVPVPTNAANSRSPAKGAVTFLNYWWGNQDWGTAMQAALQRFHTANPQLTVEQQQVSGTDLPTKLLTLLAAGTPPDLFNCDAMYFPALFDKGAFASLQAFVQRDARTVQPQDFFSQQLQSCTVKGQLYALPLNVGVWVMYYNRDLFQSLGVPLPPSTANDSWTWEAALARWQRLTGADASGKHFGVLPFNWTLCRPVIWSNGGQEVNAAGTRSLLTDAAVVESLQWCGDVRFKYHVAPLPSDLAGTTGGALFQRGRVATVLANTGYVGTLRHAKPAFTWDVAPLPRGSKGRATLLTQADVAIARGAKNPEGAWTLVAFLTSPEANQIWAGPGSLMPARQSVARGGVFLTPPPEHGRVFPDSVQYGRYPPFLSKSQEYDQVLSKGLNCLLDTGTCTAQEATAAIAAQVNALLKSS